MDLFRIARGSFLLGCAVALAAVVMPAHRAAAVISYSYSQDFNSLPTDPTNNASLQPTPGVKRIANTLSGSVNGNTASSFQTIAADPSAATETTFERQAIRSPTCSGLLQLPLASSRDARAEHSSSASHDSGHIASAMPAP